MREGQGQGQGYPCWWHDNKYSLTMLHISLSFSLSISLSLFIYIYIYIWHPSISRHMNLLYSDLNIGLGIVVWRAGIYPYSKFYLYTTLTLSKVNR